MSQGGPEDAEEAMHWANMALENRSAWQGDTFTSRVNSLYKLKAVAGMRKWQWLEEEYRKSPSQEMLDDKKEARNMAKNLAREWLEYAKVAGKDTDTPLALCLEMGTPDFCTAD